jgi:hypothetical protein
MLCGGAVVYRDREQRTGRKLLNQSLVRKLKPVRQGNVRREQAGGL